MWKLKKIKFLIYHKKIKFLLLYFNCILILSTNYKFIKYKTKIARLLINFFFTKYKHIANFKFKNDSNYFLSNSFYYLKINCLINIFWYKS